MKLVGVVLTVGGAAVLIFGVSILVTSKLPYYRNAVRRQGSPKKARRSGLILTGAGVALLVAGIALATAGN